MKRREERDIRVRGKGGREKASIRECGGKTGRASEREDEEVERLVELDKGTDIRAISPATC